MGRIVSGQQPDGAVTVLFTDVEGSTDLRTRFGDELADELLRTHEDLVRAEVERHGGREVKSLGDGFMVAFGSPRKAISCAVDIQRVLDERNRSSPGREIRVRIGINTGEVSDVAGDLIGAAVNAAARIAGKARGGQILVANVVKDLAGVRPDLSYIDRGLYWLKGFPERWRLYEILRRAAGPVEELTAPTLGKTRFVGRDSERADMRRFVEQAAGGRGALVMIGGEPGVGKTRITEEVAEEAASRGMMALVGHCQETEAPLPYAPVVEILEATTRGVSRETLLEAFGDAAPELARILPELKRIFPDLPPPLDLPPEQERRYLFNCFTEFLERASHLQPLLFVLEDVHWADESTLLLLQHLAERLANMPILMLATYRDVELDVERPLARRLEELVRRRLAHRVSLNRLPKEGVGHMIGALAGREAPASLVDAVYQETEGNCFFVEEVFQHLHEEGKLFDQAGNWRTEVQVGEIDVPEGVRLVLGRRLSRLSEGARRALSAAAVIGRNFTYELAEAVDEVGGDTLLDAVEEAQRARLLTWSEDPLRPRFSFAHELIRQTLLTSLALPRRQRLHLRVAEAIERVYARDLEPHVADLAHHLYQAGAAADPHKAVAYLSLAAHRAMEGAAFEEALRAYERALALQEPADVSTRADLLVRLGLAQRSLGRTEAALTSWREALDLYADLDDVDAVTNVCWEISYQLGWAGRPIEGMEFVQRGLIAAGDARTPVRGQLLASAGIFVGFLGDYAGGMEMIDEALAIAKETGDLNSESYARTARSVVLYSYGELEILRQEGQEAAELGRASGSPWDLASLLALLEFADLVTGHLEHSAEVHAELEPLSSRIGSQTPYLLTRRGQAFRAYLPSGDLDAWEEFSRWDLEFCRTRDLEWISNSHGFLYTSAFRRGRWEEALEHAREAIRTEPPGGFNGWAWPLEFHTLAHLGRRDEALRLFHKDRSRLPTGRPATWGAWAILHGAVEGLMILGERDEAAALYPLVVESLATGSIYLKVYDIRLSETVAGMAAHAGRNWPEAEGHFRAALRLADALPIRSEQADARRYFASMLAERDATGDGENARTMLEEALDLYRSMGMPRHIDMAEEQLKGL
jgi:class 3 adenylate cyclase/tetratricopeptide (TPR) repeat protein